MYFSTPLPLCCTPPLQNKQAHRVAPPVLFVCMYVSLFLSHWVQQSPGGLIKRPITPIHNSSQNKTQQGSTGNGRESCTLKTSSAHLRLNQGLKEAVLRTQKSDRKLLKGTESNQASSFLSVPKHAVILLWCTSLVLYWIYKS